MKITELMPMPLLLNGFDVPYETIVGRPYLGAVHTVLRGESLREHQNLQDSLIDARGSPRVYVGFGGWINLGYIAALKPNYAVLADINPLQAVYWQFLLNAVIACEDVHAFVKQLPRVEAQTCRLAKKLPVAHASLTASDGVPFRNLHKDLFKPDLAHASYGFTDQRFQSLRDLARDNKIGVAVLDIKDTARFGQLEAELTKKVGAGRVTTVHISNVLQFICSNRDWADTPCDGQSLAQAQQNIRHLAFGDDQARAGHIIHTHTDAPYNRTVWHTTTGAFEYAANNPGTVQRPTLPQHQVSTATLG